MTDWDYFKEFIIMILGVIFAISIIVSIAIGLSLIVDAQEVKVFNELKGTNYTLGQWFWGEEVIKDYHEGRVSNLNIDIERNT